MKLTEEEAAYAWKIALNISHGQGSSTLGPDDFAAQAIEKLLALNEKPDNLEGWLKVTITNLYNDRFRHVQVREKKIGRPFPEPTDDEVMGIFFKSAPQSMGTKIVQQEFVREIIATLPDKDQEILLLEQAGHTTAEIAVKLGYANAQVVATKLGQIRKKLIAAYEARQ
jgi:DNA-directed RNA polymerase specialized sigma24 family protein